MDFELASIHPHRVFDTSDEALTIEQCNLVPNANLVLKPVLDATTMTVTTSNRMTNTDE